MKSPFRRPRLPAPPLHHPSSLIATWFGSGHLPWVPGTWGSLVALPIAWLLVEVGGHQVLALAAVLAFMLGCWAAGAYERATGGHDPGPVVIDEVAAQWCVLLVVPTDLMLYLVGFILFRVADIVKPWPASVIDRRMQGGIGVMLDDVIAAAYAAAALYAFWWMVGT